MDNEIIAGILRAEAGNDRSNWRAVEKPPVGKLTWSYGGGTQSIAIALLIAQGRLPKPDIIVMADTGREASETWDYLAAYVAPLLAAHGLRVEVAGHDLSTVDMYGRRGDLLIPAFTAGGKLPTFCSTEWKQRVVRRYLRSRGVRDCVTWIGISLDEIGRMKPSGVKWQRYHWPLAWDLRMTRHDCRELVRAHGWPEPPKSSCWMCPHRQNVQWLRLKEHYPQDWRRAVALDEAIRVRDGAGAVFLHRSRVPLSEAVLTAPDVAPSSLFGEVDGCDSGFCFV